MGLKEIIDKFPEKRIAVIGDVMLDSHIYGSVDRISPEAPVPIVRIEKEIHSLGGAANVAANISSLGGEAFLFGYVGEDSSKIHLLEELNKKNIKFVLPSAFNETIQKTRVIGNNQQQIVRIDREGINKVSERSERELIKKIFEINPEVIIISDYAKGTITPTLFSDLINCNKRIIVDPKPKNKIDYSGAYLITPNLKEGLELSGLNDIPQIGKILQQKYKTNVLLTLGSQGMALFEAEKMVHIPTQAKEVYDVTGAGDSVIAAMGLGLSSGLTLTESAFLANQIAGIVVGKAGTATVSRQELEQIIESEHNKIKTLEELKKIREDYKRKGKKFSWTNGCFDLLHAGHVDYLKKAGELGDYLAVGLNSDQSVRGLKGKARPIIPESERAEVLSSLEYVDGIIIFSELTAANCLKELQPDIYIKAGDYSLDKMDQQERKIIENYGGTFKFIPITKKVSTSRIIERIKEQ